MARVSARALINFTAPLPRALIRDQRLFETRRLLFLLNNLGKYLPMLTYNISTESLFHIEFSYVVNTRRLIETRRLLF